ncbi:MULTISPECIES: hypothetical protein [unclassified Novosphingobium]|uniref:hypothetical protein n=1 Tax=unclassified Novosphingobium TaxID=2644732 RepID=UPI0013585B06|nr:MULTISPECIES: hypothetical protein [unclassified Novosphingobium]
MSMTIAVATARISRQLPEAEVSLDSALLASAQLMETILLTPQEEGQEPYVRQAALMRLARAQRLLIESQNEMLRVHEEVLGIGREIEAVGDDDGNCPEQTGLLAMMPLRRIA